MATARVLAASDSERAGRNPLQKLRFLKTLLYLPEQTASLGKTELTGGLPISVRRRTEEGRQRRLDSSCDGLNSGRAQMGLCDCCDNDGERNWMLVMQRRQF